MSNTYFKFKQFTIHQDRCAMKVSTDAVVLGALAGTGKEDPKSILEIGVGTGVVSLMLVQRFPECSLLGVELDKDAYLQACENAVSSPWKESVNFHEVSFQEFSREFVGKFDLIVSNPPYFPNHLQTSDDKRNMALHDVGLSFGDLIKGVVKLLSPEGVFWVILPQRQMQDLESIAAFFELFPGAAYHLSDRPGKKILRIIQEFSFQKKERSIQDLLIKDEDGEFSKRYRDLLREFLLIF
ncbi:hypothetical protein P872_22575 [Rhodonellum psychrophilum GCM71 = DSM 17998]|uniref:tRNA1(Val) (adenine(37)-N6)-methyltransferase n=2 Tax=Rhodonellum TaxID=336827 RepID=U5C4B0_9BACT|nr:MULTISPECIES: methyltransferase [Rhodonellum]ERM84848.1 hypothetical protein P872_22575 [Rhodonellum psychrophilum GCM71 = DSM 17998]SDY71751.1 tRNA1Val (adenine37-N6)-methyltransferase [Rhodonellum ikkaensis]